MSLPSLLVGVAWLLLQSAVPGPSGGNNPPDGGSNPPGGSADTRGGQIVGGDDISGPPSLTSGAIDAGALATSAWFQLAAGLASIIGLLVTLWGTQVRTIPYSLYRSLAWRKALFLSFGAGILLFGFMRFYSEPPPWPGYRWTVAIVEFRAIVRGDPLPYPTYTAWGSAVWAWVVALGLAILAWGAFYDPIRKIRQVAVREEEFIRSAQWAAINASLANAPGTQEERARARRSVERFYADLRHRLVDVLVGGPSWRAYYALPPRTQELEPATSEGDDP